MKSYSAEHIHNVALISHGGAGKTSLAEALLYLSGGANRLGPRGRGHDDLGPRPRRDQAPHVRLHLDGARRVERA